MSQAQYLGQIKPPKTEPPTPNGLFASHVLMNTQSPQEAKISVERVFFPHSLKTSRLDRVNFMHRSARLSSISFNLIQYGADVEVETRDINRSHFVMVIPLSGNAEVKNHDQVSRLECGRFVMLDPMAGFHFDMLADHSHLAIGIPRERLWTHVHRILPKPLAKRVEFRRGSYPIDEGCASLFDFIDYICTELDRSQRLTRHARVSSAMEEAFLTSLITSLLEGTPPVSDGATGDLSVPRYLLKAEDFILSNLTEEIDLQDILGAAGVPARTLQHAFSQYRAAGPMAWLKLQRLFQARLDLLQGHDKGTTVTDVAFRYQMSHVGRFARAYYQAFGELPSQTLEKSRS